MDISTIINSIGLLLDIIGVLIIYKNSPIVKAGTYFYEREHVEKMKIDAAKKNKLVRKGTFILFIGFIIQLVSNFF